jgi:hypothetical protein
MTTEKTEKKELTAEQTAVLQLVTIEPAPRTATELANNYGGRVIANLWPEQTVDQVKSRLKELVGSKHLKYGEEAPDGEKTLELTAAERD